MDAATLETNGMAMADRPFASVVTPSLNRGRLVRATIESMLSQDYPNIGYIVVDGGSIDETAAIVREYGDRVRFVSRPDSGQSQAISGGFRMAQGGVLAWLNSDDVFLPGAVAGDADQLPIGTWPATSMPNPSSATILRG